MAPNNPKPEDVPLGTGKAQEAKEAIIKHKKQMKPADCYLLGKDYDPKTKNCI